MEFMLQYISEKEILVDINYVWRFKGVFLLVELVGERGGRIMDCYKNDEEGSAILWKDEQYIQETPTANQFRKWTEFLG